ncbi:MAG TPA: 5'/3'-nucleotidase SurE [Bacteroidales bacterium]|nr:5'/3'-nucleotidase SurE [Bacteroidales bacterium]HPS17867.1 5'/3'-nucleotidase SurE [Bacteroidales bacterium]
MTKTKKEKKPVILITNDDGIMSPGIRQLIKLMRILGDVVVVAPDKPQSAMGHAITIATPLRLQQINIDGRHIEYSCSGTPVDCVKLAVDKILFKKPDMLVSGINHGSNSSINVIYSGTMSAALEGAIENIPSIGFSILDYSFEADFTPCEKQILTIARNVLQNGLPKGTCLNVNIPKIEKIKGIKICRQAIAYWDDEYYERKDPHHKSYYWLTGEFINNDKGKDTDEWALKNGYISVVPVLYDFTAHHAIPYLKNIEE